MSKVITVSGKDFEKEVLKSDKPILVDFWASWCGPCRMMAPILDELSEEMVGEVKIAKMSTEDPENAERVQEYNILSIPNMKLFKGGEVIAEYVGLRAKEVLKKELEEELRK